MKPTRIAIGMLILGAVASGLACVEENYDPWRPMPEPSISTWEHPVVGGQRNHDRSPQAPFDGEPPGGR